MLLDLLGFSKLLGTFKLPDKGEFLKLAKEHGSGYAANLAKSYIRDEVIEPAIPEILSALEKKAPLDGKRKKDKDGNEYTDREYFVHEALYAITKRVMRRGGFAIDFHRDRHFPRVLPRAIARTEHIPHLAPMALLEIVIQEELEILF